MLYYIPVGKEEGAVYADIIIRSYAVLIMWLMCVSEGSLWSFWIHIFYQCSSHYMVSHVPQTSRNLKGNFTKYLKSQPCDVIKMRYMGGEAWKKTPEKEMDNPSFLWRHLAHFLHNFAAIWSLSAALLHDQLINQQSISRYLLFYDVQNLMIK